MINSRPGRLSAAPFRFTCSIKLRLHVLRAPLIPKLRGHFAEFLNVGSLEHLWILSSPTCVGLRYGRLMNWLRGFSRQYGGRRLRRRRSFGSSSPLRIIKSRICLRLLPTGLNADNQRRALLSFCVTPSLITFIKRYGNINPFPIDYAFRPRLRDRLTLGGQTFPRKP